METLLANTPALRVNTSSLDAIISGSLIEGPDQKGVTPGFKV